MVTIKEVVQECMDEYKELNAVLSVELVNEIINEYETKNKEYGFLSPTADTRKTFKNSIAYDIHDKVFNTVNKNFENLKSYNNSDNIIVNINLVTEDALRPICKKYNVGTKYIDMIAEAVMDERLSSYEYEHLYEDRNMAKFNVGILKSYIEDIRNADINCCKNFKAEIEAYN